MCSVNKLQTEMLAVLSQVCCICSRVFCYAMVSALGLLLLLQLLLVLNLYTKLYAVYYITVYTLDVSLYTLLTFLTWLTVPCLFLHLQPGFYQVLCYSSDKL